MFRKDLLVELKINVSGVKMFLVKRGIGRVAMLPMTFFYKFFSIFVSIEAENNNYFSISLNLYEKLFRRYHVILFSRPSYIY